MNTGIEQSADAGALEDGTAEVAPTATDKGPPIEVRHCENCDAVLAGEYCSQCGQRHRAHPVHHFWHFVSEATEDLTHADSRLWQTMIALLFRPGFLTREFLDGRRVRYLPPVRLYLVVSVIYFIVAGVHSQFSRPFVPVFSSNGNSFQYHYAPAAGASGPGAATRTPKRVAAGSGVGLARTPAQTQRSCEKLGTIMGGQGGWLARFGSRVKRGCLAATTSGGAQRLSQSFERNLERAMFLLLPLLALVMKPLYIKPPRHYVEHLLFLLHNQAFLFVVLGLNVLLEMIGVSGWMAGVVHAATAVYVPIYFYLAMRRVYRQSRWRTLGKLTALGAAYFFLGMLMFAVTFSYSFLTL